MGCRGLYQNRQMGRRKTQITQMDADYLVINQQKNLRSSASSASEISIMIHLPVYSLIQS